MVMGSSPVILAGRCTDKTVKTEYLKGRGRVSIGWLAPRATQAKTAKHARHKQELKLVLHALYRLLHKVHVLAPVAQRMLPTQIKVYDPVHWHLS